ncbi:NifB/NifX family molybdenum-iron cluster-binding protein [Haloimpatiens lingqiaonensis]|uniref:NifB/NifX family molybdenum-iron cluster-binding protein n=1 Tax=Haloimpatiens lingqiaonensis TaxID=1380675 RepID=UPI0010FE4698|nr:NifB/NifX family molybdenum-iron cluster-binding protein [Haloimpatiens lingqiaonensis]
MKIAMPKLNEELNQHFGKSEKFAIVTTEGNEVVDIKEVSAEALQHNHEGLAEFLESEKVEVVIAGGIGQGAYDPLIQKGFKVVRGASGKIEELAKAYLEGSLKDKKVMCNHHHSHEHHASIKKFK